MYVCDLLDWWNRALFTIENWTYKSLDPTSNIHLDRYTHTHTLPSTSNRWWNFRPIIGTYWNFIAANGNKLTTTAATTTPTWNCTHSICHRFLLISIFRTNRLIFRNQLTKWSKKSRTPRDAMMQMGLGEGPLAYACVPSTKMRYLLRFHPSLPPSTANWKLFPFSSVSFVIQVLLVTSSRRPDNWIVPGGGVEPNEEPHCTAVREVLEEAGVVGTLGRCLGMFEVNQEQRQWQWNNYIDATFLLLRISNTSTEHRYLSWTLPKS